METPMLLLAAFGAFAGFLCGLLPMFYAVRRGNDSFGTISLLLCVLAGASYGFLLAVPLATVLTIVIAMKEDKQ